MSSPGATDGASSDAPTRRGQRVLWVTNLPAPYRLAVWDDMVTSGVDLEVRVLAFNEKNRSWGEGLDRPYLGQFPAAGVEVKGRRVHFSLVSTLQLLRILRQFDAVVIGGWDELIYWRLVILAAVLRKGRVLFYESTGDSHRFRVGPVAWARQLILRHGAEAVLVPGEGAEQTVKAHGVAASKIVKTFNSIDQSAVLRTVEERRGEAPGDIVRFCFAGRLLELKNVESLLKAFWSLHLPGRVLELHIVGQGPMWEALHKQSEGLSDGGTWRKVVWHGGLSPYDSLARIAESHVLVLPSVNEVWGLVVNEALAAGLHVVVSRECGVAASVAGMTGVHVCGTSPAEIRSAMEAAARDWKGWISEPEILSAGSPARFARDATAAVHHAVNVAQRRSRGPKRHGGHAENQA